MKPANFFLHLLLSAATVVQALPSRGNPRESIKSYKREPLQDVVSPGAFFTYRLKAIIVSN